MTPLKRYTSEDGLRDVLEFAEGPIQTSADWRRVLTRVLRADTGFVLLGDTASELQEWSPTLMMRLRNELRAFLRSGLTLDEKGQRLPQFRVEFAPAIAGASIVLTLDGPVRDVLWFQIVSLLRAVGLNKLRQCVCGRVFAKTGRREFCSARCQKRIYMRGYRQ